MKEISAEGVCAVSSPSHGWSSLRGHARGAGAWKAALVALLRAGDGWADKHHAVPWLHTLLSPSWPLGFLSNIRKSARNIYKKKKDLTELVTISLSSFSLSVSLCLSVSLSKNGESIDCPCDGVREVAIVTLSTKVEI